MSMHPSLIPPFASMPSKEDLIQQDFDGHRLLSFPLQAPLIHPTAVIDPSAKIEDNVSIGPYAIVGSHVHLHTGVQVGAHAVLQGPLVVREQAKIFPFASIGLEAQDLKYAGEWSGVLIGPRTVVREFATIHRGTGSKDEFHHWTTVGKDCLIMAYVHIAHDCSIGDHVVLANQTALAGHVQVQDYVVTGGRAAVHQFVRLGESSFVAAGAMLERDLPPFCRAFGNRAALVGLNTVGLKRRNLSQLHPLKAAYRRVFRHPDPIRKNIKAALAQWPSLDILKLWDAFIHSSRRGIVKR